MLSKTLRRTVPVGVFMARGATVRNFEIELSDVDRGVYETLSLKVAQHPSESDVYLVTRLIAYALEFEDGLDFGAGLSAADEPAIWVRDLTGALLASIEIGTPDPARLHKASKASERVAVYCHKEPAAWLRALAAARVHAPDQITLFSLPQKQVGQVAGVLDRRNRWSLSRMEGTVYLEVGEDTFEVQVDPIAWPS